MTVSNDPSRLLRTALRANAICCCLSGVTLLGFSAAIASWLGLERRLPLMIVGGLLLVYAVSLVIYAGRRTIRLNEARTAIGSDLAWVIGTAALLWAAPDLFSLTGKVILIAVALLVGAFALLQFLGGAPAPRRILTLRTYFRAVAFNPPPEGPSHSPFSKKKETRS